MDIARVVFFCDDRKVGAVLRTLAGIAIGTPEVTPVVNAQKKGNGLEQATRGQMVEMLRPWLKKKKITEVNSNIAREFCKSIGMSEQSYTYLLNKAREAGVLRKTGKGTLSRWKVV